MKKIDVYICEGCGKVFTGFKAAISAMKCEISHKDNIPEKAKDILEMGYKPCDMCENGYNVYGCEFDCQHLRECGDLNKGYKYFELDSQKF